MHSKNNHSKNNHSKKNNQKFNITKVSKKLSTKSGGAWIGGALVPRSVKKGVRNLTTGSCDIGLKMGIVGSRDTYSSKKLKSVIENHRILEGEQPEFKTYFSENLINLCGHETEMIQNNSNTIKEKIANSITYTPQSNMRACVTIMECLKSDRFVKLLYDINRSGHGWSNTKSAKVIGTKLSRKMNKEDKKVVYNNAKEDKKHSEMSKIMEKKMAVMIFFNNIVIPIIKKYMETTKKDSYSKLSKNESLYKPLIVERFNESFKFLFVDDPSKADILNNTEYFGELGPEWFQVIDNEQNDIKLAIKDHPLYKLLSKKRTIDKHYDKKLEEDEKRSKGLNKSMLPPWAENDVGSGAQKNDNSKRCAQDDLLCKEKTERDQPGGYLIYIMLTLIGFAFAFEYSTGGVTPISDNSKA